MCQLRRYLDLCDYFLSLIIFKFKLKPTRQSLFSVLDARWFAADGGTGCIAWWEGLWTKLAAPDYLNLSLINNILYYKGGKKYHNKRLGQVHYNRDITNLLQVMNHSDLGADLAEASDPACSRREKQVTWHCWKHEAPLPTQIIYLGITSDELLELFSWTLRALYYLVVLTTTYQNDSIRTSFPHTYVLYRRSFKTGKSFFPFQILSL